MSLDPDAFRAVLGRFASGVTVVTCLSPSGDDIGMTVSAFSSVSLTPPLVLVCVDHHASIYETLLQTSAFAVNVLAANQEPIARRFATTGAQRFQGIGFSRGPLGIALLDDALATLECKTVAQHPAGDHTIIIGEAEAATTADMSPLLYYRGGFASLQR
jgi:flavin reductase (DIM6/NTAB) family NADH-FMN oxidoreductase RutF